MEHIFVINPAAGPSDSTKIITEAIAKSKNSANCQFYCTKGHGDATNYVAKKCSQSQGELRFYACGGDGTLNEVVNGAIDFPNASVGVYPCGTGNDFVKYYGGAEAFLDIDALIEGSEHPIDLIRANEKYCINVFDFGFDTAVVRHMERVKTQKVLTGKSAYYYGVIKSFFTSMKTPCRMTVDGEVISDGYALLCTVANGTYVGSTFKCAPRSNNDDGLLEVCFVKPISRLSFFKLIKYYVHGEHLDNPIFKDIIIYRRARKIGIEGGRDFNYALDGELIEEPRVNVEVVEKAINFIIPRGIGTERNDKVSLVK